MNFARFARVSALVIAVLAVAAPTAGAATAGPADNGKAVSLVPGESLTVKVKPGDSGSTGSFWEGAAKPSKNVLKLTSQRRTANGKQETFTYKALRPGGIVLKLQYKGPGRHAKTLKTFGLNVVINETEPQLDCSGAAYGDTSVVVQNTTAVVFRVRRSVFVVEGRPVEERYDAFYGCEFATDHAFRLGNIVDVTKPIDLWNIVLNGHMVGYVHGARCPYNQDNGCPPTYGRTVESQDLHSGQVIRKVSVGNVFPVPEILNAVPGLVVSATGGLGWIEQTKDDNRQTVNEVHRSDGAGNDAEQLDSGGSVDPDSLQLNGTDMSWVRDGERQSAPLR